MLLAEEEVGLVACRKERDEGQAKRGDEQLPEGVAVRFDRALADGVIEVEGAD